MRIDVNLKINEEFLSKGNGDGLKNIASGWVELEKSIKFPVNIRKYFDEEEETDKLFVSFPQVKEADGTFSPVLRPENIEVRKQIQDKVMQVFKDAIVPTNSAPEITDVKVHLINNASTTSTVQAKAMASITVCGVVISGLVVKEGRKGLFVQMPQYKKDGKYYDHVYGTNDTIRYMISQAVLNKYAEISNTPKPEVPIEKKEIEPLQDENKSMPELQGFDMNNPPEVKIANPKIEDGMCNFILSINGNSYEGTFCIYNPFDHSKNMKLISIENREAEPLIDVFWDSLEDKLKQFSESEHERLQRNYNNMKDNLNKLNHSIK